ncbi:MAG TPA: hypothetical protein VEC11_08425 [Allosphingosinicella sp.]|nr:hypothetical protein [Allosphingosinicella sp.]
MSRRHDVRRIKAHFTYSADELARTLDVNVRTVRKWKAEGLRPIEGLYPQVFAPQEIVRFIQARQQPRQPLAPGEIYCVACKRAQRPAGDVVNVVPRWSTNVDLVGVCPSCARHIYRRVSLGKLECDRGTLGVRYEDGTAPYSQCGDLSHSAPLKENDQ